MSPRQLGAAAIGIITTGTLIVGVIVNAVHDAAKQVRIIRDELQQNPPTTVDDLDRVQRQITEKTRQVRDGIQDDLQDGLDQIDQGDIVIPPAPTPRPASTPKPPAVAPITPRPTLSPTPRLLPPLPPILP